ncbi:uncharacterized protein B0I36DRAFT_356793 [Microdochium trichocladiopsis]|uniref:Uncharacterized protein n=1 Tax=Microdochium trichocladiopsis TaxID=1682393 RepID=A0A9P8XP56_9PEZI|nr:uncharacterized protein B0I36DRAFT_356793 [Microdochium trichocladiopsis]KAH7009069.1 hypothetical protein B0I36DRAFT_356793 [Microdochium trichocladiopsis]
MELFYYGTCEQITSDVLAVGIVDNDDSSAVQSEVSRALRRMPNEHFGIWGEMAIGAVPGCTEPFLTPSYKGSHSGRKFAAAILASEAIKLLRKQEKQQQQEQAALLPPSSGPAPPETPGRAEGHVSGSEFAESLDRSLRERQMAALESLARGVMRGQGFEASRLIHRGFSVQVSPVSARILLG